VDWRTTAYTSNNISHLLRGGIAMPPIFARIDTIDQLILDLERDDIQRQRIKKELIRRSFEAQPNATPAERLLRASEIEAKYPTPILHAIEWDTN
jgi:hypothetical protein